MTQAITINDLRNSTVVYLQPYQNLRLVFSPAYGKFEIEAPSELLDCCETPLEDGTLIYNFGPILDIVDWAKISQTFFGEIKITYNDLKYTIGVVLDSENKSIITVIDPEGCEVRLRPNQLLEVILTNCEEHPDVNITKGSCGLKYAQINWPKNLFNKLYYENTFRRKLRQPAKTCLFELSNEIEQWAAGTYSAGSIILSDNDRKFGVFVNLKLKRKDRHKRYFEKNVWRQYYQEINLKSKSFTLLEDGCRVVEVHDGVRIRQI